MEAAKSSLRWISRFEREARTALIAKPSRTRYRRPTRCRLPRTPNRLLQLVRPYIGVDGVLTGSSRVVQEIKEKTEVALRRLQVERTRRQLESRQRELDARIAQLQAEFEQEKNELDVTIAEAEAREKDLQADLAFVAKRRTAPSLDEDDGK